MGPPWSKRELGFVITENVPGGISCYYEPHCDFDAQSVAGVGRVDIVISPPSSQLLLGYPLVRLERGRRGGGGGGGTHELGWQPRARACCCRPATASRALGWRVAAGLSARTPLKPLPRPPCPRQVKGDTDTLQLLQLLRPTVLIPLMNAEFEQSGPLATLLVERGGPQEIAQRLARTPGQEGVRVEVPRACEPLAVRL